MDYKKACSILSISPDFTLTELKHRYYKEALKNHPDKKGNTETFQEINEAYSYLLNYQPTEHKQCIQLMDIIKDLFNPISLSHVLDTMNLDMIYHVYDLLPIIKLFIPKEQYEIILNFIYTKLNIIVLEPTLDDLFQQKIFIYQYQDQTYHIPLWHSELLFDTVIFKCNPILPEFIQIDETNDIIITIHESISSILSKEELSILQFNIKVSDLYIRPFQTIVLKNKGIPKINTEHIFHVELSNIIIHLNLSS
jgi:DnaJ domain